MGGKAEGKTERRMEEGTEVKAGGNMKEGKLGELENRSAAGWGIHRAERTGHLKEGSRRAGKSGARQENTAL